MGHPSITKCCSSLRSVVSVASELLYLISGQIVIVLAEVLLFCLLFSQVQPRLINPLKNLRRLGLKLVVEFFSDHEAYSFSVEEIDAVFHAVVWPQVTCFFLQTGICVICTMQGTPVLWHSDVCVEGQIWLKSD